ncbi:MAG: hypothetical protein V3S04_01945 [Candidatus Omnitrophota bacterium]
MDRFHKETGPCRITEREKMLEEAIRDAALKLDATKRFFKSRKIKEVREDLINAIKKEN